MRSGLAFSQTRRCCRGNKTIPEHPAERHTDRLALLEVSSRTPPPIASLPYESRANRIQVHVIEFLLRFLLWVQIERIILRLPKGILRANRLHVLRHLPTDGLLQLAAASALSHLHKPAEAACGGKPDDGMYPVGHRHKPDTTGFVLLQFLVEHSQHNPFRMVMVQEPTTSINRKRDEMGIQLVIDDLPRVLHATILHDHRTQRNLLGLRRTGSENRCHPRPGQSRPPRKNRRWGCRHPVGSRWKKAGI